MFSLIQTRYDFDEMWSELADEPLVSVDTETTGLAWWRDKIVGASFANPRRAWYLPVRHVSDNCPIEWLWEAGERLENRQVTGHNIMGFDFHLLRRDKWKVPRRFHDSGIAAYTLNENWELKLEALASVHLGIDGDAEERQLMADLAKRLGVRTVTKAAKAEMWRLPPAKVVAYASRDALSARQLIDVFLPKLKERGLLHIYTGLIDYERVVHRMTERGVCCDQATLDREDDIVRQKCAEIDAQIRAQSGGIVENPASSKQLQAWCGTDSVAKAKLAKVLADPECDEELPPKLALIRLRNKYAKAHGTYYAAMREALDGDIIHPALRVTGASVRLSCGRPPMQGIPRTKEEKPHPAYHGIKSSIVARPGRILVECDLSQAEIVSAAHFSKDTRLVDTILRGLNLHDELSRETGVDRDGAKTLNFSVPYGIGAEAYCARRLQQLQEALDDKAFKQGRVPTVDEYAALRPPTLAQGKAALKGHYTTFPSWRRLYLHAQNVAKDTSEIKLWTGRTRHFHGGPRAVKAHSAMNVVCQGAVAEFIRLASIRLDDELPEFEMGLSVHDSLLAEIEEGRHNDEVIREAQRIMGDWPWMHPCVKADSKRGKRWSSLK